MRRAGRTVLLLSSLILAATLPSETRGPVSQADVSPALKARLAWLTRGAAQTPVPATGSGSISGTVTDASTGDPLEGIQVLVKTKAQGMAVGGPVTTDAAGHYTYPGLEAGTYVVVTIGSPGHVDELWNNRPCPHEECDMTEGDPIDVDGTTGVSGKHFALAPGVTFSGVVTDLDVPPSAPVPEYAVWVSIYDAAGNYVCGTDPTDASGRYTSPALLPGVAYYVQTSNDYGYLNKAWDDIDCAPCNPWEEPGVTPLTLTLGAPRTDIDFVLDHGGRISGTVSAEGTPVGQFGSGLDFYTADGTSITWALTDASGHYMSADGLPAGTYFVVARNLLGYTNEVYDDIPCTLCDPTIGTPVAVTVPDVTGQIDFDFGNHPQTDIDLRMTAFTAPGRAGQGVPFDVTDTTRNEGPDAAPASTTVFFLSGDEVWDPADVAVGERPVPPLNAGGTSAVTTSVTLPAGVAPGDYYLIAVADGTAQLAEDDDTNNASAARAIEVGFDLVVASLSAPPSAGPGVPFTANHTTRNLGPGPAPATVTRFYLSANATLSPDDVLLGESAIDSLAAGAPWPASVDLTLPPGTAGGEYFLMAVADGGEAYGEVLESNNLFVRGIKVGFDFITLGIVSPPGVGQGVAFGVKTTTRNAGPGPAPASTTSFYLSADAVWDPADVVLGSGAVNPLPPGGGWPVAMLVTVPEATAPGDYVLLARSDAGSLLTEVDETNNTSARAIRVGFDLTITMLRVTGLATPGADVTVTEATRNLGPGAAPASTTRFFLSADAAWDPGDVLLGGRAVGPLPKLSTSTGTSTLTVPAGTAPGIYTVIAVADGPQALAELREDNNTAVRTGKVGGDLAITGLGAPVTAARGAAIRVSDVTKNHGPGLAAASITRFYLSADAVFDVGDVALLPDRPVGPLVPRGRSAGITNVTIPGDTAPGGYFLLAVADADGAVPELDEANNTRSRPITVK